MPATDRLELMSDNPMYLKAIIMWPSQNAFVRKEIDHLLAADIITPVESSWTSSVDIATK